MQKIDVVKEDMQRAVKEEDAGDRVRQRQMICRKMKPLHHHH